ncbi:MAG TPA: hypothetical protein VGS41_12580, partial [Chthonomonadales bacterium]|nr:hypothetical protein [Chthonomonadales bacterium]
TISMQGQNILSSITAYDFNPTSGLAYGPAGANPGGLDTVQSVSAAPSSIVGGTGATGAVTLSSPAPANIVVALSSSNTSVASVPYSVEIPAGATSGTFPIGTTVVTGSVNATISASANGSTQSTPITVTPNSVASVSLSAPAVIGGIGSSTGTVTLAGAAPAGGKLVTLSSNSTTITIPSSVTVSSGSIRAFFMVNTAAVTSATTATITAAIPGSTGATSLSVLPDPPSCAAVSPSIVIGGVQNATCKITLKAAAPIAASASISASGPAASGSASVTIPAGSSSVSFPVTSHPVTARTSVRFTITVNGTAMYASITVLPDTISAFTLSPATIVGGVQNAKGTITLQAPAPKGGVVVALASTGVTSISVPASITIPAGAISGTFVATSHTVPYTRTRSIEATTGGLMRSASITIAP